MSEGANTLVEIPVCEWARLRDLYAGQANLPCAFGALQTALECIQRNPELNIRIYALNGAWEDDGTFIMQDDLNQGDANIVFNTLSANLERLVAALNSLNPEWTYRFLGIPERLVPAIEQNLIALGHQEEDFEAVGTFWYHISRERVEQFVLDAPPGITVASLHPSHAEQVNNVWPHKTENSVEYVERLISCNESAGAFNEDGELIAWCLLPLGSLGLLHVEEPYRRRGLGQLMVRCMGKKLAAKGLELMAPVIFENMASRSMFERMGARVVDRAFWGYRFGRD